MDECNGKLDVNPTAAAPGNWKKTAPEIKSGAPNTGQVGPRGGAIVAHFRKKHDRCPARRTSPALFEVMLPVWTPLYIYQGVTASDIRRGTMRKDYGPVREQRKQ